MENQHLTCYYFLKKDEASYAVLRSFLLNQGWSAADKPGSSGQDSPQQGWFY